MRSGQQWPSQSIGWPLKCRVTSNQRSRPPVYSSIWKILRGRRMCNNGSGRSADKFGWIQRPSGWQLRLMTVSKQIEWYGHARLFRRLWAGLLRAAILEALLERKRPGKPRLFDEALFTDLLGRLEKVKPQQSRSSPQTLDERWQFVSCHVTSTSYLRTGTVAHTSVSF